MGILNMVDASTFGNEMYVDPVIVDAPDPEALVTAGGCILVMYDYGGNPMGDTLCDILAADDLIAGIIHKSSVGIQEEDVFDSIEKTFISSSGMTTAKTYPLDASDNSLVSDTGCLFKDGNLIVILSLPRTKTLPNGLNIEASTILKTVSGESINITLKNDPELERLYDFDSTEIVSTSLLKNIYDSKSNEMRSSDMLRFNYFRKDMALSMIKSLADIVREELIPQVSLANIDTSYTNTLTSLKDLMVADGHDASTIDALDASSINLADQLKAVLRAYDSAYNAVDLASGIQAVSDNAKSENDTKIAFLTAKLEVM